MSVPGAGLAVLVNANAKRGGRRVAVQIARALPAANVRLTKTIPEIEGWLRTVLAKGEPRAILSAGGDGTAVALLNALDHVVPKGDPFPIVGPIPLGTGNAWAHTLGARKLHACVQSLAKTDGPLPTRRYSLFSCEGTLTFFAGCGWDAEVLNDYREQVEQAGGGALAKSVWGYLSAMLFRTVPKTIAFGRPHLLIENLADEAWTIDPANGEISKIDGAGRGTVLYEGMASVSGCATCPEYGYRFRAFPNAERLQGFMNVRVYDQSALRAVADIPKLWVGQQPLPGMTDWFSTKVRMTYSRSIPLEIGGEAVGLRRSVDYEISPREVHAVDWRLL